MESKLLCISTQTRMTKKPLVLLVLAVVSVSVVIGQFAVKKVKAVQDTTPNVGQDMILALALKLCILT